MISGSKPFKSGRFLELDLVACYIYRNGIPVKKLNFNQTENLSVNEYSVVERNLRNI